MQKTFVTLIILVQSFFFWISDTGGLSDQKNNAKPNGMIIKIAAIKVVV